MRRILPFALLPAVLLLLSVGAARADTLSLSADVPIVYTFNAPEFREASPSGVLVGFALPFFVGIGGESYKVTGQVDSGILSGVVGGTPQDYEYRVSMVDVFFDIPFPAANLRLGGGLGTGELSLPASPATQLDSANLAQLFFNVGIPFAAVFDVHVGYHAIMGEIRDRSAALPVFIRVDAKMATVGLKVGF